MKKDSSFFLIVIALFLVLALFGIQIVVAQTIPQHDHVVIVVMENHSSSTIIGSSNAPYINSLINGTSSANFTKSYGLAHPSQPNYLMLFSGSKQGVSNDALPSVFPFTTPNLGASLLSHAYTFTGYSEDLPSVGFNGAASGKYARKHNPWVNWQNASTNGIASVNNRSFSNFPSNFSLLPTVSIVIPNLSHDMHDPSGSQSAIANGDTWLQNNLDAYIQWAKTHNSLFILTFDEDDGSNSNHITTVFVGKNIQPGQYTENVSHYSILRTLEDMYALPYAGNSSTATPITDCWKSTPAPTGGAIQTFCNSGTIANLNATGTAIKWYASATGGSALPVSTALVNLTHYYASQTVNGSESTTRLNVKAKKISCLNKSLVESPEEVSGSQNFNSENISVYPNPSNGIINVAIENANFSELFIRVMDIQGKEVWSVLDKNYSANYTKQINLEGLTKGIYYIKLNTDKGTNIQKLIIQ